MNRMLIHIGILMGLLFGCKQKEDTITEDSSPFKKMGTEIFNQKNEHKEQSKIEKNKTFKLVTKDTIFWRVYDDQRSLSNYRMFLGKVKSSEEIMWKMERNPEGKLIKSNERYYVKGSYEYSFGFKIEFDSLGRKTRFINHRLKTGQKNPTWEGRIFEYDSLGNLNRKKILKKDRDGFYSTTSRFYNYKKNKSKPFYNIFVNHDDDDQDMWTEDSLVYKYNKRGDLINTQFYEVQAGRAPLVLEKDFGKPTTYTYDDKGRVTQKIEYYKDGPVTTQFFYKNGKLFRKTRNMDTRTNVHEYYPYGVPKFAKLRTTPIPGDYQFNPTGQVTHYNGKKVADFSAYDEHGNWRVRISYDKQGNPETYTNRVIEYYE